MPSAKDDLHHSLAESAPISVVEDKVESSLPMEVEKEKTEKGKGKAIAAEAPSTANVATRFATKVAAQASAPPDVMGVGNPSIGPLALVDSPSQSEAPVSQLSLEVRKRKVVAIDASVTSSGLIFVSFFIENADMEALILAYMQTNAHDAIYTRIQDFLSHVSFSCPLNSFIFK